MTASERDLNNNLSTSDKNISGISYSQQEDKPEGIVQQTTLTEIVSGPIPHPRLLREYNKLIPGAAERIMSMAEKQQDSRISAEKETREAKFKIAMEEIKIKRNGQAIALLVILIIFGLVCLFTFTGHETIAIIILGIGIASLASAFMGVGLTKKSGDK